MRGVETANDPKLNDGGGWRDRRDGTAAGELMLDVFAMAGDGFDPAVRLFNHGVKGWARVSYFKPTRCSA